MGEHVLRGKGGLVLAVLASGLLAWLAVGASASVYYVAGLETNASDDNPGTEEAPLRTISAAMVRVQPGDTVLVKAGTYRESVRWEGPDWGNPEVRCTLQAYPGQRPVIKGSEVIAGPWERVPGERPVYRVQRETYTQMVFVDEVRLRQIGLQGHPDRVPEKRGGFVWQKRWDGKGLEDMVPGSFYYDAEGKRLYVWLADGGDPAGHVVEAAVRPVGVGLRGTWTLSGFDVRHVADGLWPEEQAVAVSGNRCVVEGCRITQNEFLGLIVSGEDCIIRGNELAHNGLEGFTSNWGYRMLVEGNEFHHNAWRGDVVCLTAGNKWVQWRDSKFLRNWWHDEPATALWLDISDGNILIAENRFDNCAVGVYFEICRWGVIANNVFRNCGRALWSYSSDVLIAHNVADRCGEGITITGYPRHCNYNQSVREPARECLMAVRNNLVVNNLLIDCVGSYVGITGDSAFGAGNFSDYNAFVWTIPAYHRTGNHIHFMSGWHELYARLPQWRMQRHYDEHSVVVDPGLLVEVQRGAPYVALGPADVVADAGLVNRELGDYRLLPDSPLRGRGVAIPPVLNAGYVPGPGHEIISRMFAKTLVADAPDPSTASSVYGGENGHYRLQPLPPLRRLVDLDSQAPGTPGLNEEWMVTGAYPVFDRSRPPEVAADDEWCVYPDNRLLDPSFDREMGENAGQGGQGPWVTDGGIHTYMGMACANLFANQRSEVRARQRVGVVAPQCEYILWGDAKLLSQHEQIGGAVTLYLAAGDELTPLGPKATAEVLPMRERGWCPLFVRHRAGKVGEDEHVGKDLWVVIAARVEGPAEVASTEPVLFARWDNLVLLTGETP